MYGTFKNSVVGYETDLFGFVQDRDPEQTSVITVMGYRVT